MKRFIALVFLSACASAFDETTIRDGGTDISNSAVDFQVSGGTHHVGFAIEAPGEGLAISNYYYGYRLPNGIELGISAYYFYLQTPRTRLSGFDPRIGYAYSFNEHFALGLAVWRSVNLQGRADFTQAYLPMIKLRYKPVEIIFGYMTTDDKGLHSQEFGMGSLELRFEL